jgi:predicted nucleotidyltransferase
MLGSIAMSRPPLSDRDSRALDEFARRVRAALGDNLMSLRLFGSKARGDAAPDSDLDVLVVVAGHRLEAEDAALDIAFDVNLAHDVYISPRVIDRAVFEHPVWRITPFVQALEREGVPL